MAVTVQFQPSGNDLVTLSDNVSGYRISACLTPTSGLRGNLYVYVSERVAADDTALVDLASIDKKRGDLSISGGGRSYSVEGITCRGDVPAVTRRQRGRVIEFSYSARQLIRLASTTNTSRYMIPGRKLHTEYQYGIGDGNLENLLACDGDFRSANPVIRLYSARNRQNSWLELFKKVATDLDDEKKIKPFSFTYSKHAGAIEVNAANLRYFFVEEVYGELAMIPPPAISQLVAQNAEQYARLDAPLGKSAYVLQQENEDNEFEPLAFDQSFEIATFVFSKDYDRFLVN